MMSESPFDEAVARPLLNEPVKKKWSWKRLMSNSSSSRGAKPSINISYRSDYKAPPIHEICFDSSTTTESSSEEETTTAATDMSFVLDEEVGFLLRGGCGGEMELETVDAAIMRERYSGIREVNDSMRQMNEIQKDLARVVQDQQDNVYQFNENALESLDRASGGLSQLLRMQQYVNQANERNAKVLWVAATLVFLVVVHWLFF